MKDKNNVGTSRNPSHLQGIIDFINDKVFLPQANVFVRIGTFSFLKVDRVLGRCIRDPSEPADVSNPKGEAGYIVSFRDRAADINVFFVIDYESGRNVNKALAVQYEQGIFVDDDVKIGSQLATVENVLAHEIAHYLGVGGESHYYYRRHIGTLMYYRARGGLLIPKYHANLINR